MRECGECTLCCTLLEVPVLEKASGEACAHCHPGGCSIYYGRPGQCHWDCLWLAEPSLPDELRPDIHGVLFEPFWDARVVVAMAEPGAVWKKGPPANLIHTMLADGYVVWVMQEKDRHVILPEGVTQEEAEERAKRAWRGKWQARAIPQT